MGVGVIGTKEPAQASGSHSRSCAEHADVQMACSAFSLEKTYLKPQTKPFLLSLPFHSSLLPALEGIKR